MSSPETPATVLLEPTSTPAEKRTLGIWGAVLHLFKGNIGPGVLALPFHFVRIGPLGGLLVTVVVAVQGIFTMLLLLQAQQTAALLSGRVGEPLSFEEVGTVALGLPGRIMVQTSLAILQLGICAVFISFCATNLMAVLSYGHTNVVLGVWGACSLLALLPTLKSLVPLSLFGSATMLTAIIVALAAAAIDLSATDTQPALFANPGVSEWGGALAATFYAFEGIGLVLPISNQVAPPTSAARSYEGGRRVSALVHSCTSGCERLGFPIVMLLTLSFVAALFAALGCTCGAAFPAIQSASITAFLAKRNYFYQSINILVAVAVLLTFPLQLTPASQVIESSLRLEGFVSRCLCKLLLVAGCTALVLLLPNLDTMISVIGSLANTSLAAIPCIFHAVLLPRRTGSSPWSQPHFCAVALDVAIVSFCLVVMGFGIYAAVHSA